MKLKQDGFYYIRLRHYDPGVFGPQTGYTVKVYRPLSPLSGDLSGVITGPAGHGIGNAVVETSGGGSAISLSDGSYLMLGHDAGSFTMTVRAVGYATGQSAVELPEGGHVVKNFQLIPTNTDTDQDGLPDAWEIEAGTDPLRADADEDPDEDGMSNAAEFAAGGDPRNKRPYAPELSRPEEEETDVSLTPILEIAGYEDAEGDTHAFTQWQITTKAEGSEETVTVLSVKSASSLLQLQVVDFVLQVDTEYTWRARVWDQGGASDWSESRQFTTTEEEAFSDTDNSHIPDDQDVADMTLDLDQNGTADMLQEDIWCLSPSTDCGPVGLKPDAGVQIEALRSVDCEDLADTGDKPEYMPFGALSFKATVPLEGDTATVTVYLSEEPPQEAQWYKYDPDTGWRIYPHATIRQENRKIVDIVLKDGDREYGDADGTQNRVIIDPSGIGALSQEQPPPSQDPPTPTNDASGTTGSGSGGGCFIETIKTFSWGTF